MSSSRVLPLAGACNLRDFGGYATRDGRFVRARRLFRSGILSRLSPDAIEELQGLGIRTVCDLRRTSERARQPNPAFGDDVRCVAWDTSLETSPIRDAQFAVSATIEAARAAMVEMYRRMPFRMRGRLAGTFGALMQSGDGGFLVHCTAGKDRTGVAVALILSALGVPRETIVADYVLTNTAVDLHERLVGAPRSGLGIADSAEPILALAEAARTAVLDAHPSYIAATFDEIDQRCGSVERYLRSELDIDGDQVEQLREAWLVQSGSEMQHEAIVWQAGTLSGAS